MKRRKRMKNRIFLLIFFFCIIPTAVIASQITIFDNQKSNNPTDTWHGLENEDEEVESNTNGSLQATTGQNWDLEGMFFDGTYLSIVGGWDFVKGSGNNDGIGSGDIFISTSGAVSYGISTINSSTSNDPTGTPIENNFGYNYVFDIDWENFANARINDPNLNTWSYTLWQITEKTFVTPSTGIGASNPVAYHSGAVEGSNVTGSFTYTSGLSDTDTGFSGGNHFMLSGLNITDIPNFKGSFTAHFTQECGNDTIMGQVPEPATMILLGMGLLSISAIARKLPL